MSSVCCGIDCPIAINGIMQVGKVIILARSVTPADLPGEPIPPPPAWPKVRMEYPRLTVAIEPIDEKVRVRELQPLSLADGPGAWHASESSNRSQDG